jgi:hypothetical protein
VASIKESPLIDPRAPRKSAWLQHPLAKFGIAGEFVEGLFADIILHFIEAMVLEEPDSELYKGAAWFLLKSERTYFYVCAEAGIDAARLRDHLKSARRYAGI